MYLARTPDFIKKAFPDFTWNVDTSKKEIFLTFDDGPTPDVTEFVLQTLQKYKAKATFFCLGKNIELYPEIYAKVLADKHSIGSHTYDHPSGWTTDNSAYFKNIETGVNLTNSQLFRPPYGRIKMSQAKELKDHLQIVMWDVLSGDFDEQISVEKCYQNVVKHTKSGSIVVFHDSIKAKSKLYVVLPKILEYFDDLGYQFKGM